MQLFKRILAVDKALIYVEFNLIYFEKNHQGS